MIRQPYSTERVRVPTIIEGDSLTVQYEKEKCDINNVIKSYDKQGILTHINTAKARYGDFTNAMEYREALDKLIEAQNMFEELPAKIRKEFDNDPAEYYEFVNNPDNAERMEELGLLAAKIEDKPLEVFVTNSPKADGMESGE